ncbi:hypothetical protein JX265_002162 [Neoarthrinium moseri]|uniref:IDI-2 n=1 Tax=Neoarthrinium moseri TaxID=1658444 RepID=A0A9Q0AU13_9PEZI|nr:uncharacterized protein JN550_007472 [Neoarthrinium moseri]KAI1850264.1 hypothetical protein JX266_004122 [Neoarthrinium moseri]KAI1866619.1 hypothetical protein JN550_007472 [Neoarthrinium moseri]KAI1879208.1 hypothetical protein JX265_002162 [Neoarthrinium moseri]
MKFNAIAILTVFQVLVKADEAATAAAAAQCGDLGVLSFNAKDLPDGVNASDVRNCAEHPLGNGNMLKRDNDNETTTESRGLDLLSPRDCYDKAPYGCTDGYCWKACGSAGDGKWCWTANNGGLGSWITCKTYNDCGGSALYACGKGLNCKTCGCSC